MMDLYLRLHRTVAYNQVFAVQVPESVPRPLSDETVKAIANALGTSDLQYWPVLSDTTVSLPFRGEDEDAVIVTLDFTDQPKITVDNEILEVIELSPGQANVLTADLSGSSISDCRVERPMCFKFYVPELYRNVEFLLWLESSQAMTMHQRGTGFPDEDSLADVAIYVDPSLSGEGSDSDMPGHDLVVERIKSEIGNGPFSGNHIMVILTNTEC